MLRFFAIFPRAPAHVLEKADCRRHFFPCLCLKGWGGVGGWTLQGQVFQRNLCRQLSPLPPEVGELGECDSPHGLTNIGRQLALAQSNCSAMFSLCLCHAGIQLFIGREKLSVSTLIHQSVSACWCIHLLAYVQESMYAKESVAEE